MLVVVINSTAIIDNKKGAYIAHWKQQTCHQIVEKLAAINRIEC